MRVMNVMGYAQPTFPHEPRRKFHRVETVTLASSVSIIALLTATALHVLAGVHETPLVIGTILIGSIAGWVNAYLPAGAAAPGDGGHDLDDHLDELELSHDWYDRAA